MTDLRELNGGEQRTQVREVNQTVANLIPFGAFLILFNVTVFVSSPIAFRAVGIAFLLIVPGATLMSLTPLKPTETSVRFALSMGASILLLMLLGLLYSLLLPHLGIPRPLSRIPVLVGIDVMMVLGLGAQARHRDPLDYLLDGHIPSLGKIVTAGLFALLPVGAIAGAERLNNGHGSAIALAAMIAIGVVLCSLFVFVDHLPRWSISTAIYSATAATLFMGSMRSNYPIGFDIQSEYYVFTETLRNGLWHLPTNGNPYSAMLSITVLPTIISLVTHATGIYLFKIIYPLVFSIFPVLIYVVSARWFPSRAALIGAIVLVAQGNASGLAGLARQEIGLLFFALLVVIAFDESIARRPRQVATVVAGLGMAISHYSTAYFACTILVISFLLQLMVRRLRWWSNRWQILLNLPVVIGIVGVVVLWNVVITRSAQNVLNLASSLQVNGFQFLPGGKGASLLTRFLNSDVAPTVSPSKFTAIAVSYYQRHFAALHPYPVSISSLFPLGSINVPVVHRNLPASYGNLASNAAAAVGELILLLLAIGIVIFLWQNRNSVRGGRTEFGFIALGCVFLLALLRLSGTVSTLYNAGRGQVQGAPLLSIGLACVCASIFTGRSIKRSTLTVLIALGLGLIFFTGSGLSGFALGGGAPDTLVNFGSDYENNYFTTADITSAEWLVEQHQKGQIIYVDEYGANQLIEISTVGPVIPVIIPQVIEPGAFVYATASNIVDKTAQVRLNNTYALYQFPLAFLNRVKNVVFSTGTTEVFR